MTNILLQIVKKVEKELSLNYNGKKAGFVFQYDKYNKKYQKLLKRKPSLLKNKSVNTVFIDVSDKLINIEKDAFITVEEYLYYDFHQYCFIKETTVTGGGSYEILGSTTRREITSMYKYYYKKQYEVDLVVHGGKVNDLQYKNIKITPKNFDFGKKEIKKWVD